MLERLTKEIKAAETNRMRAEYLRGKTIGHLTLAMLIFYLMAAAFFYFYYFPKDLPERLIFLTPLIVFPLIIHLVRKWLHFIFVQRINHNELILRELHAEKTQVLDQVKENETYKVAQELLEKYDPEYRQKQRNKQQTSRQTEGTELRRRHQAESPLAGQRPPLPPQPDPLPPQKVVQHTPVAAQPQLPQAQTPTGFTPELVRQQSVPSENRTSQRAEMANHTPVQPQVQELANYTPRLTAPPAQPQVYHLMPGYVARPAPGPPMPCPIFPRERSAVDKVVEYLVGDGPNSRYALICSECHSHNGMALADEFEYLAFRCAYCYTLNPARKQKPNVAMVTQNETHHPSLTATASSEPTNKDDKTDVTDEKTDVKDQTEEGDKKDDVVVEETVEATDNTEQNETTRPAGQAGEHSMGQIQEEKQEHGNNGQQ